MSDKERGHHLSRQMAESVKIITGHSPRIELVTADSLPLASGGESKSASARVEDRRN